MKKNIAIPLLLICLIVIIMIMLLRSCSQITRETTLVPPVNISLSLIPGTPKEKSLVVLRLFSRKLQQEMLDGSPISSIQIIADENTWTDNITFSLAKGKDKTTEIDKSRITLLRAQKDKKIAFHPRTVFQIFYAIEPSACLIPGQELSARLKLDKYTLKSNKVTVPPVPKNKHDLALRRARIHSLTNSGHLITAAETLIQEKSESHLGYWYQGIALEDNRNYQGALKAYKKALQYYPQSTESKHYEPPVYIISKIRRLQNTKKNGTTN
ncbi:MAG: tetratricopeptide repeat protein [Desulfobacula sp.]|uniref:tetratricopeptide repeat protein n=1 Tax=Desulfobacula sp. TaxID=2593537 RepID=UPI0025C581E3|nr:tetratricopeptide repeat protein [Desulfobacula sp.]MCD4721180.1 tetratricopeptide repeat protein [Desulfobacula sp.]